MRYRSAQSFESQEDMDDWFDRLSERYDDEAQAADDACSEPEDA